jgi:hypothetical protein
LKLCKSGKILNLRFGNYNTMVVFADCGKKPVELAVGVRKIV